MKIGSTALTSIKIGSTDINKVVSNGVTYWESYTIPTIMYIKIDTIVAGQYLDYSGNNYRADVVTISEANDGLKLADNENLKNYIRLMGLYDLFYDSLDAPIAVLKSQIGRIYNNTFFNNDIYIAVCAEPLTGSSLLSATNLMFGAYDADALLIIAALGVTTELQKRLVDTHVKDLKALNAIQADFFKYNDLDNSVLKALHPMVGTTFGQMAYNWIKPTDADASYRLELLSGAATRVFDNAINFDGTFCLDTNFNASTKLVSTNSFSYYSLFNLADEGGNRIELGNVGTTGEYKGIDLKIRRDGVSHSICEDTYQNPSVGVQYAEIDSSKYYLTNKDSNSDLKQYRQGTQIGSTANPGASVYYDGNILLGGYSVNGVVDEDQLSILPCGYYHIGGKIDSGVLSGFNNAVIRLCSSKNYYYFSPDETASA